MRTQNSKSDCLVLSVRQPWAWLILNAGKDIENRTWPTKVRGRILIHASKACTRYEYEHALQFVWSVLPAAQWPEIRHKIPERSNLPCGGIVGSVELIDCVARSNSSWFTGPFGFVLARPETLEFEPIKGQLGFFKP